MPMVTGNEICLQFKCSKQQGKTLGTVTVSSEEPDLCPSTAVYCRNFYT